MASTPTTRRSPAARTSAGRVRPGVVRRSRRSAPRQFRSARRRLTFDLFGGAPSVAPIGPDGLNERDAHSYGASVWRGLLPRNGSTSLPCWRRRAPDIGSNFVVRLRRLDRLQAQTLQRHLLWKPLRVTAARSAAFSDENTRGVSRRASSRVSSRWKKRQTDANRRKPMPESENTTSLQL
jgi:hypothetical protein